MAPRASREAGGALAVVGATLDGEAVGLRATGDEITELGPEVEPLDGDTVIDGAGTALVPGFVNAHTHAAMTLFRGYADDLPLMEWLENHIWPAEARLTEDDVYWGTRLACVEMIRSGTTRFFDMYWHPTAVARAVRDSGMRALVGNPLIDGGDATRGEQVRAAALEALETTREAGGLVEPSLTPHSVYAVSRESLEWVAEVSAERDLPVQIHLSETAKEVDDCVAANGCRPAKYLDSLGLLGPRTALAHGVHLDDSELDLIAERGATVVTNPTANMKLAVGGFFPYARARVRGVEVALGTDGPGSNNSLDLFGDAKLFALVHKHAEGDPAAVSATEALAIARGARSSLVGGSATLAVGQPADFLLVRTDTPELGIGELHAGLVYAATGEVVDITVVAGQVLMRGRIVEDAEEVLARSAEVVKRLSARTAPSG